MIKTINLPCFEIVVKLFDNNYGTISSNLKDGGDSSNIKFDSAIDGVESLILSCACEGIDIESPAFLCAIETTIDAISFNLD